MASLHPWRALAAMMAGLWSFPSMAETLRIAHIQPFPPFAEARDGKSVGLGVDLLRAAAGRTGLDLVFVPTPIEQMNQTVKDGGADGQFLGITPERRQTLDFSDPVLATGGALFVRKPLPTPAGLAALAGTIVVTPNAGPLAAFIRKTAPEVNLRVTTDYEESLAALANGTAAAAALNYQTGMILANRNYAGQFTLPDRLFQEVSLAVGVPKGQRAETLLRLNKGIQAIRADGTWTEITTRWANP